MNTITSYRYLQNNFNATVTVKNIIYNTIDYMTKTRMYDKKNIYQLRILSDCLVYTVKNVHSISNPTTDYVSCGLCQTYLNHNTQNIKTWKYFLKAKNPLSLQCPLSFSEERKLP